MNDTCQQPTSHANDFSSVPVVIKERHTLIPLSCRAGQRGQVPSAKVPVASGPWTWDRERSCAWGGVAEARLPPWRGNCCGFEVRAAERLKCPNCVLALDKRN